MRAATSRSPPPLPPPTSARIEALDTLRGAAVLGILPVNIQLFAMPEAAYQNPTAYADLAGINLAVWFATHVLADMKFLAIFSMMFGASTLLFLEKAGREGRAGAVLWYRRMFVLLAIGLAHAYLLWSGDILAVYAVCGMLLYFARDWPPRRLVIAAILGLCVPAILMVLSGLQFDQWTPDELDAANGDWLPSQEMLALEVGAYQGGWQAQNLFRIPSALEFHTSGLLTLMLWRAGGLMLIGMALYRWGVLTARRAPRFYLAMTVAGLGIGLPVVIAGAVGNLESDFDLRHVLTTGSLYNYWGSLGVCLGYVGLVMWICASDRLPRTRSLLAAVGRTALSNYLLQTLLCTTVFYGYGLGLFGQLQRSEQFLVVLCVWVVQIAATVAWLRRFRSGPVEWAWRTLQYGRVQPMRRSPR